MRHRITSAAVVLLLSSGVIAGPAGAHGALESPLSRAAACGADSPLAKKPAACKAATAASGSALPGDWDNLRVANVAGRDRQVIPDGALCSGGLPAFKGLDLARADWPATTVKPGARFAFRYRGTIPHRGTFRLYVTTAGYDPAKPLKWSDLEREPFLEATDPQLTGGSYVIKGRLPTGRTGRHLIYTIWQNSDTPDTYYSCSDVIFRKDGGTTGRPRPVAASQFTGRSTGQSTGAGGLPWQIGLAVLLSAGVGVAIIMAARARRLR
ncbi:lytic polysaccharide monooxygenase auxiliary activity family 9 protein [Nonomuraea turkmeniaca]|uniref:lytic polysaccharide monooxygenase auxiliary activity family 9 protein n=1 Tax=Nonomuraea turkmeniaca TaxID=103838 RepID=UPI001B886220|nr:lytic polysaccharide monooxygenase [Nonomuraea turkmeniaca]